MSHHKLREARNNASLTQSALGRRAGRSASTISNIECHRGPDVPADQRRPTKTRLATALALTAALGEIPTGEYSVKQFVLAQSLFTEEEIYEAIANQLARAERRRTRIRRTRSTRHLVAVA